MKPYYEDEHAVIYHGDCREILPQLGPVDLVLTDPPYSDQTHTGAINGFRKTFIDFQSTTAEEIRKTFELTDCKRWIVSFMDYKHAVRLEEDPPKGFRGVRIGIWNKETYTPQFTGDRPAHGWEAIGMLHRLDEKMRWNGGGKTCVYTAKRETNPRSTFDHATVKPLWLVRQLIEDFSDPDSLILDPFMGSGTTLRAAKDLGRRAIGIEIERRHCDTAIGRLRQESLFGAGI